jgi:hypothetical protein
MSSTMAACWNFNENVRRYLRGNTYQKAVKHPVHLTVALLDLFDHIVARDAHLE